MEWLLHFQTRVDRVPAANENPLHHPQNFFTVESAGLSKHAQSRYSLVDLILREFYSGCNTIRY